MGKGKYYQRIKIFGEGGQGVQFLTDVLINYLGNLNYFATFFPEYDTAVRGGQITAEVAYDVNDTPCPQGTNFDAIFYLNPGDRNDVIKTKQEFKLKHLLAENQPYQNMYILGKILRILNLPFKEKALKKALPDKYKQTNYQLIKKGYKDYESYGASRKKVI